MRKLLKVIGTLLIIGSVLALGDVGMTLWSPTGEVITAVQHSAQQGTLKKELGKLPPAEVSAAPAVRQPVMLRAPEGYAVGRLSGGPINTLIVQGREQASINKAPGLWGSQPGEGRTVVISGHRTTHGAPFRYVDRIRKGQVLTLATRQGAYRYRVVAHRIVLPQDMASVRDRPGRELLILTACHPLYSAQYRYLVIAERV